MAIKVSKRGKKAFKASCSVCGCEFSYRTEDLKEDAFQNHYVECPYCKQVVPHDYELKKKCIALAHSKQTGLTLYGDEYKWLYADYGNAYGRSMAELDSAACHNKAIPDLNKLAIGATPWTLCQKSQPYRFAEGSERASVGYTVTTKGFETAAYAVASYFIPDFTACHATPESYKQANCEYAIDAKQ